MRTEKAIQAIATIRTISETKRKELNLFFEAEQAKREAKIKTRFLQSMSHDMRTPLMVLRVCFILQIKIQRI